MTDASPKSNGSLEPYIATRRNKLGCDQCRYDKQKCCPEYRDWDEQQQQKCERCVKLGHPCGPPLPKSRKSRQPQFPPPTGVAFDGRGLNQQTARNRPSRSITSSISIQSSTLNDQRLETTELSSRNESSNDRAKNQLSTCLSPSMAIPTRKQRERSALTILKTVGDLKAWRRNFYLDLQRTKQQEISLGSAGPIDVIKSRLIAAIRAIEIEATTHLRGVTSLVAESMGSKDYIICRLLNLMEEFERGEVTFEQSLEHDAATSNEIIKVNEDIRSTHRRMLRKKYDYSDAETVSRTIGQPLRFSPNSMLGTDEEAMATYERAADHLWDVVRQLDIGEDINNLGLELQLEPLQHSQRPYSAAQLAYRAGDRRLAIALRNISSNVAEESDHLHRTLLHYAAIEGDVSYAKHVAKLKPQLISTTGLDFLGMSPLAHAAVCKQNIMFNFLLRKGAIWTVKDYQDRNILSLAARCGNQDAVHQMLVTNRFSHPVNTALCHAIEGHHEAVARLILGYAQGPSFFNDFHFDRAATVAEQNQLFVLARDIRTLSSGCTPSRALSDVNTHHFNDVPLAADLEQPLPFQLDVAGHMLASAPLPQQKEQFPASEGRKSYGAVNEYIPGQQNSWPM